MIRFPRLSNIVSRPGIIFLAYLLLFVITGSLTILSLEALSQDTSTISLTSLQGMLLRPMTDLELESDPNASVSPQSIENETNSIIDQSTHLISNLLKRYENIPIVWVELETTKIRFFTSHSLTAR